ncbi:fibronectin type III domain-containing protein [Geomonas sp. Red69]|uniref:Fibronectin type III domain-containing protein n=1 Tax=Geomonas diazotrophica TaxID=2843197 RepID=A0ABX8JCN2_9BACT|nr:MULTISPECIES: fibronectin type III domain-containing protein [Geomonas]MBU5637633.1 fibronectin type III domain-containing protein [Geomonas diazotrophica]QWV96173.1 fibronectin type III domain-containing protein [Geomonas nitrogeniifigens]QXE85240.1 fibronectin type III domain-containing protein [Geomonas nitrogeniifigens]
MGKNRNGGEKDEDLIRATGDLLTNLIKDPSIMQSIYALLPNLEKIQGAYDRHRNAFYQVLDGAHDKEGELEAARNDLTTKISLVNGMAHLTGKHDPTIPQKLGLVQQIVGKRLSAAGLLVPGNFRMAYEGHSIVARASAVKGARSYEIWVCEGDPLSEASWRHLTTSGRVNRIEITGLTPGRLYYFRIRAVGAVDAGPFSNFVSMMAI